jgi:hypothetical protein
MLIFVDGIIPFSYRQHSTRGMLAMRLGLTESHILMCARAHFFSFFFINDFRFSMFHPGGERTPPARDLL